MVERVSSPTKHSFGFTTKALGKRVFNPFASLMPGRANLSLYVSSSELVTFSAEVAFVQNMAKPPASLPPSSTTPLKVTLLIGAPSYSPVSVQLPDLIIPASHPAPIHPDEASFHTRPEIHHTFRAEQKLPPKAISAIFAVIVLAPWVVLVGLVRLFLLALPRCLMLIYVCFFFSGPTSPYEFHISRHPMSSLSSSLWGPLKVYCSGTG